MGIGITPNGSKTCWSRRRSVAIASLPEKRNKQPRPEDVVLGGPPRGGRFRVVAPVGGGGVGKAPPGPLVVTRGPTLPDDSPTPPGRGYIAARGPHPARRCSRSSPAPRNSDRSSDAHAAAPDGSAQRSSLSGSRGRTPRCTSVECSGTGEGGRASHALPTAQHPVDDTQIPQDGPDLPPQPSVEDFPAVFRYDHDVVLTVPTHMGQALPLVHRLLLPAPRGLPGRTSLCRFPALARRIARSSTGLTARGRGISPEIS